MNNVKRIMLLTAFFAAGCASSEELKKGAAVYGPLTANEHREELDSKIVVIKGWLSLHPESECVFQNKYVEGANIPLEEGVTVNYGKAMQSKVRRLNGSKVEISGTFHKNILGPNVIVIGACNETAIDVENIKSIE